MELFANREHLQGEEAKNIPGESVTEEHYMDHDGNLISRKVMYNVHLDVSFISLNQERESVFLFRRKQETADYLSHCLSALSR